MTKQWAAFSASAKIIETTYAKFTALFNEMYEARIRDGQTDPQFSFIRMLAVVWRRRVFANVETVLRENVLSLLKTLREENYQKAVSACRKMKNSSVDDPRLGLLTR